MDLRGELPDFTDANLATEPIERSETIPSSWYTRPEMHEADRTWIFARSWQYAGPASKVRSAGEFATALVAGNPILLVRGKDGILRAFYNVCRHRGGPLALEEHGTCNALQCKYHGWTYLLDGSLRGVPKFDRAELFDKKDFGLVPVAAAEWEGMLFVNLSAEAAAETPLAAVTDGIAERIAPAKLGSRSFVKRVTYDVRCNWKVYVDNYLEGYHLPFVHPELCSLLDTQQYVTETFPHYSLQYSPLAGTGSLYAAGSGDAYYYCVFPNFMLNILPGRLQTNLVVPAAHDATKVIFDYYYDDISSPKALALIEEDLATSDRIQLEDIEICERVQEGLNSDAYDKGRFSVEMEQGVYHFQTLLKSCYARCRSALR